MFPSKPSRRITMNRRVPAPSKSSGISAERDSLAASDFCFDEALEGCGDSTDGSFSSFPRFEIIPASRSARDVCEGTGSPAGCDGLVRLPLPHSLMSQNSDRSISDVWSKMSSESHYALESFDESMEEDSFNDEPLQFECEEVESNPVQTSAPMLVSSLFAVDHSELIELLSECARLLELNAQALYLAVSLLDACLMDKSSKGKKIDAVQREILSLTCLYISSIQLSSLELSSDEFISRARIVGGNVKGRMISCQLSAVESLLGLPLRKQLSFHQLWSLLDSLLTAERADCMSQFVCKLSNTAYAEMFFPEYAVRAAIVISYELDEDSFEYESAVQVLLGFLYPPLEAEMDSANGGATCGVQQKLSVPRSLKPVVCR